MGRSNFFRQVGRGIGKAVTSPLGVGLLLGPGAGLMRAGQQSMKNAGKKAAQQNANHNAAIEGEARAQTAALAGARADTAARQARLDGERQNTQNKINAGVARSGRRRQKGGIFGDDRGNNLGGAANQRLG